MDKPICVSDPLFRKRSKRGRTEGEGMSVEQMGMKMNGGPGGRDA